MRSERPTLCERCLQFRHPEKYCRIDRELCTNCAEQLQEERMLICGGNFCLYCNKPHKMGDQKKCEEYKIKATIQSEMRLNKCNAYTAKEILGCKGRNFCVSAAREAVKRKEKKRETEKETSLQIKPPNKEER